MSLVVPEFYPDEMAMIDKGGLTSTGRLGNSHAVFQAVSFVCPPDSLGMAVASPG